jgi:geranylgeranyl pyrophosphate synthase
MPLEHKAVKTHSQTGADFLEDKEIQTCLHLIDSAIDEVVLTTSTAPKLLYDSAYHLIRAGGKRLRSLIVILSCEGVGGQRQTALPVCVAVELLHTASLIQDDIVDRDVLRRGVSTVHEKYGRDLAILACGLLAGKAFELLGRYGNREMVSSLSSVVLRMSEGVGDEVLLGADNSLRFTWNDYLSIIRRKTATSFAQSALIGALLGDATEKQKQSLTEYGCMLGMAFQIRDDVLDTHMIHKHSSDTVISDVRMNRANCVLIHALEASPANKRQQLLTALDNADNGTIRALLEDTRAVDSVMQLAESYVVKAKQALQGNSLSTTKLLEGLADFCLVRTS